MRFIPVGAAIGAVAIFGLTACQPAAEDPISRAEADLMVEETTAPALPQVQSGVVDPVNSLNGSYNLRASECGQAASEGALTVAGSSFQFYETQCRAVSSTSRADAAEVQLSCSGEGAGFNRLVQLRLSPGILRMEEDGVGLRYYRCPASAM